jgi:hypothetical protein
MQAVSTALGKRLAVL